MKMAHLRFLPVTAIILMLLIFHELHTENIFPAHPILASEIGWWLIALILTLYVTYIEGEKLSSLGIKRPYFSTLTTALAGFILALIGVLAFGIITQLTGIGSTSTEERLSETATAPWWWITVVFLRAGVVEELFFRGFIISRAMKAGAPEWLALLLSTTLFVIPHAFFWPGPSLILVGFTGIALGLIFIWKRDLLACIIAHIGVNMGGVIASLLA